MDTKQEGRTLKIKTPLGEDYLLIESVSVTEAISELFTIEAELLVAEKDTSIKATIVDPKKILGQQVTITVRDEADHEREFTGIVNGFVQGFRNARFTQYHATIVPHAWVLTQKSQSRIFQQKSVPDILKEVFTGFQVKYEFQGNYEPRNYCVQYRETDFAFASRLMEEEGIFYFFEHAGGALQMILADSPQSHRESSKGEIPFHVDAGDEDWFVGAVRSIVTDYKLLTGKVILWDSNFQLPSNKLDLEQPSLYSHGDNQNLESYDYPGGYARKYDGIDKSGGESQSDLNKVFDDRSMTVKRRMEGLDAQVRTVSCQSDSDAIMAGFRFKLVNHPNDEYNTSFVVTSSTHFAGQSPSYVSDEEGIPYSNRFDCIGYGSGQPCFRPKRSTPKPLIHGGQTAVVVGPSGEEIFTDKYGRVKVQFHWDREGQVDAGSSCWVRVAQSWAGNKWGGMFIPRIGMEVIVHFLEGDPDQPIITGCVYNPMTMPPYSLPEEKTKSTLKSNSSKGGGGFNEFRFEDKKGEEQIFVHGERNLDVRIKKDSLELIGNDKHTIVENDNYEKVAKDKHVIVGGDKVEAVGGTISLSIDNDLQSKIEGNYAVDAGMGFHLKAGMSAVIEAGVSLTLKVGGNFININSGGISISGTMLMLNSGGAAGSGAGCSADSPNEPKVAANAEPGGAVSVKPKSPPQRAASFGRMASSLKKAAQYGTAFCET